MGSSLSVADDDAFDRDSLLLCDEMIGLASECSLLHCETLTVEPLSLLPRSVSTKMLVLQFICSAHFT